MLIFLLILSTAILFAICYYFWQLSKQLQTYFFSVTEGKIVFLERSEERAYSSNRPYQFNGHRLKIKVNYEYYADNSKFINNKLYYGEPKVFFLPIYGIDSTSYFVSMLVMNEIVEVFYNSKNPHEACLIQGVRFMTILILTVLLTILAGCIVCISSAEAYKYVSDNANKVYFLILFPVFMYFMYLLLSEEA